MLKRHGQLFGFLAVLFDAATVSAVWMLCYVIRFRLGLLPFKEAVPPGAGQFAHLLPLVISCDLIFVGLSGLYRLEGRRSRLTEQWQLARSGVLGWLALLAALYYYRSVPYSRVMLFMFFFANSVALLASRAVLRWTLRALGRSGWTLQHVAIVGTGELARRVLRKVRGNPALGLQVDYFAEDDGPETAPAINGVPVIGSLANLAACVIDNPVDTVFVAVRARNLNRLEDLLDTLAEWPVDVVVVPDFTNVLMQNAAVYEIEGLPMIQIRGTPMQGWRAAAKRAVDIVGAALLLALFAGPMLLIALLIKLTGPVLYRQKRMGLAGKPLTILKFRTMPVDAEDGTGPVWSEREDPRCTRLGRWLRRTDLDELPQLLNVLRGEMSLVGPRPERPHFVERFVGELPAYMLRHSVKAGMTGWAQVNGLRGKTSLEKRLRYDLYYINNWSLGFDLLILLLTPFSRFLGKDAV
ncbi:MAG: undecaprenyl-phosphate glucose phosphotransferase [Planctomycetota bacterium]